MAISWKFDAWKGVKEEMWHINKYSLLLALCRIKEKKLDTFDFSIYRPFSEYVAFFEEYILENKVVEGFKSEFIYNEIPQCKTIITKLLENDKSKISKDDSNTIYKIFFSCTNIIPNLSYTIAYSLRWTGLITFLIFGILLFLICNFKTAKFQILTLAIISVGGLLLFIKSLISEKSYTSKYSLFNIKHRTSINDCLSNLEDELSYLSNKLDAPKTKYTNMNLIQKKEAFFNLYNVPENFFEVLQQLKINEEPFLLPDYSLNSQIDFPLFITYLKNKSRKRRNANSLLYELFKIPKTKNISQYVREYSVDRKEKELQNFSKKIEIESKKISILTKNNLI